MKITCPKCNTTLEDPKGGGTLTKCRKCGYDGNIGFEMSYLKNEWEIQTKQGEFLDSWKKFSFNDFLI